LNSNKSKVRAGSLTPGYIQMLRQSMSMYLTI